MLRLIRPIWFVPFAFVLAVAGEASAQTGRLVKNTNEIPNLGSLVGKTVCLVITDDPRAEGSKYESCSKVVEIARWSYPSVGIGTLRIKLNAAYPLASMKGEIFELHEGEKKEGEWIAFVRFEDEKKIGWNRGVPVKHVFIYD